MKKQFLNSKQSLTGLLTVVLFFLFNAVSQGQPCEGAQNPESSPLCQPPGNPFKVLLVLDESGSISGLENKVEAAVDSFAAILHRKSPALGKIFMGIVEFNHDDANPIAVMDVKPLTFISTVKDYLYNFDGSTTNPNYQPGGTTDYVGALSRAQSVASANQVDIIFFITDGDPDTGPNTTPWIGTSDAIKNSGVYIFGIAVGSESSVKTCAITALSGIHKLGDSNPSGLPYNIQNGADWTRTNFTELAVDLANFANSITDTQAPSITCPINIRESNDLGMCGKKVTYPSPVATDNCTGFTTVCTPPPGSFFNVGQTIVNCTVTDMVGLSASCSFTIKILDLEAPKITCPANKLISCEESSTPANTGSPTTSDNCGVASVSNADIRVDGSCPNEFTINRTWTVVDIHGNANNCLQVISVEDKKKPVITCPANITVTCDTSIPKTGMATATDNCDMSVSITNQDIPISGDCDWFCITERHWTATDDCGNFSKCVQVVTKDVTPLIEKALEAGPLVWGQTAATVTLPPGKGACVVKWLPYVGVVPTALKFDDAVAGADCKLMTNPLDRNTGQIVNPLLGEAMKLKILVRLNPGLGLKRLKTDLGCTPMHFIVRQALAGGEDATVNELLRVADLTLGNINVNLLVPEHCLELLKVLKCANTGRTVCNNP
ncbi:MAG: HYR domain-containing protein [Saprospiraceae bacterium]|jgi:hypothetical protein|nr:HYR domain-containing protein [Saprospiraceae bacterium]